jgi:hypothetical protein
MSFPDHSCLDENLASVWLQKLKSHEQINVEDALDFVADQMDALFAREPKLVDAILSTVSNDPQLLQLNEDVLVSLLFFTFPFKDSLKLRSDLIPKVIEKVRLQDGNEEAEKTRKVLI